MHYNLQLFQLFVRRGKSQRPCPDVPDFGGNMKRKFFLVLILVLCLAGLALAQTDTARLIGTITDSTGAVVSERLRRGDRTPGPDEL